MGVVNDLNDSRDCKPQYKRKNKSPRKSKNKSCKYPMQVNSKFFKAVNKISVSNSDENNLPYIDVDFGSVAISALLDSGAMRSILSKKLFEKLLLHKLVKRVQNTKIQCVTATKQNVSIDCCATVKVKIEGFSWYIPFLVSDDVGLDVILGVDVIEKTGMVIDLKDKIFYFKFYKNHYFNLNSVSKAKTLPKENVCHIEENVNYVGHLSEVEAQLIQSVIDEFPDVLTSKLGLTDLIEYDIKLTDEVAVKLHPYKLNPIKMEQMRNKINKLLDQKVIQPSTSNYSSPAFLIPQGENKQRLVIDYRQLNKKIVPESIPLPDIHGAFHYFSKAKVFTIMDLNSAFNQIPLSAESRKVTAFATPFMLYEFLRVPFGISQGSAVCSRLLEQILHDVKFKFVYHYLDDIVVYSDDMTQHIEHLREVLSRLKKANLTVNPSKVKFAVREFSFLGHVVTSDHKVKIDPDRTKAIREFKPPKDAKGVARFLGMVNYFNKYIPNFATISKCLNDLRKKGSKFVWEQKHTDSFEMLKKCIISPPVLHMADFSKPFIVQTDSSSIALGCILMQEYDGCRFPVSYASRTLTDQERKFSTYELECLAILFALDKFKPYLEHREFLLECDNQSLTWLLNHPKQLGRIGRWILKISTFKFQVKHIRSSQNIFADALSRMFNVDDLNCDSNNANEVMIDQSKTTDGVKETNAILTDFPLAFNSIASHQRLDARLLPIIEDLEKGNSSEKFILSKGVLCCRIKNSSNLRVVPPDVLKSMILKYYHSEVGAHLGVYKTIHKIRKEYFWDGMNKDISNYVKKCNICALSKPARDSHVGKLISDVPTTPMNKLYIDYSGPYPRSRSGNTMLLICVDSFSKYVWMFPMRRALASTTVNILENSVFKDFGTVLNLVSDNGPQFRSRLFKNMCFKRGINHITTTEYHPQSNLAERYLRNLHSALIAYHADDHTRWDENLSWIQFAFNSARHEGHKTTPFELMFTYKPNHPLAAFWHINDLLPDKTDSVNIKETWNKARANLKLSLGRSKKYYDKKVRDHKYVSRDLVLLKSNPISKAIDKIASKLCYRWLGPYKIQRFITPVTVALCDPYTGDYVRRAHVSQLKKYEGNT